MSDPDSIEGTVHVEVVGGRSKSAQRTVTLHTDRRVWLLRHTDGPRIGVDSTLAHLAGRRVRVTGFAGTAAFLATTVDLLDEAPSPSATTAPRRGGNAGRGPATS